MRFIETFESRSLFSASTTSTTPPTPPPTGAITVTPPLIINVVGTYTGSGTASTGIVRAWQLKITSQSGSSFVGTLTLSQPLSSASPVNVPLAVFSITGSIGVDGAVVAKGVAVASSTLSRPGTIALAGKLGPQGTIDGSYDMVLNAPPGTTIPTLLEKGKFHVVKVINTPPPTSVLK